MKRIQPTVVIVSICCLNDKLMASLLSATRMFLDDPNTLSDEAARLKTFSLLSEIVYSMFFHFKPTKRAVWVDAVLDRGMRVMSPRVVAFEGVAICGVEQWCDPVSGHILLDSSGSSVLMVKLRFGARKSGIFRTPYKRGISSSDFDLSQGWLCTYTLNCEAPGGTQRR